MAAPTRSDLAKEAAKRVGAAGPRRKLHVAGKRIRRSY